MRTNPWLAVGVTLAALLVLAWLGWAVHITSDHGAREGLGVLIAWPAIVAAIALISIPFIWAFRVIRASRDTESTATDEESGDAADAEATEPG